MKTYLHYLYAKLREFWKEDKFIIFFLSMIGSIFLGTFLMFVNLSSYQVDVLWGKGAEAAYWEALSSPLSLLSFGLLFYGLGCCLFLMLPWWETYLSWAWGAIKLPYSISKWLFYTIQDSYYSYRVWKGWDGKCCFNCEGNASGCERTHPATKTCDGYRKKKGVDDNGGV